MSAPELPRSRFAGEEHEDMALVWYVLFLVGLWELGWLVLSLAGAAPHGQLGSAWGRVGVAMRDWLFGRPVPSGFMWVMWAPAHPVSPVSVILVVMGMVLVAATAIRILHRLPDIKAAWSQRGGASARSTGSRKRRGGRRPASAQRDTSLKDWLANKVHGEDD
ncbi:MAG: hypothetical protein ACYDEA_06295 [Candidatus Dormibacteria bacterium]